MQQQTMNDGLLPWQLPQWELLAKRFAQARFPHALLFSGVAGIGKQLFSTKLAASLFCQSRHSDFTACGTCPACRLFYAGNHPDFMALSPEGAARQIKIAMIRQLASFLQQTSQQNGYQVVILSHADRMNTPASNAILKTLEEPLGRVVLILLSDHPAALIPTIRSRCQIVRFSLPDNAQASAWLTPQIADAALADKLLRLAGGAPIRALDYAKTEVLEKTEKWLQAWTQLLTLRLSLADFIKSFSDQPVDESLRLIALWLQDFIRSAYIKGPGEYRLMSEKQRALFQYTGEVSALYTLLDSVNQARAELNIISGLNGQLILETLLIDALRLLHQS
jgi:DNA polymerase III subunit delta'